MASTSIIKWRPIWKVWIPILLFLVPLILESQMAGTLFTPYLYGILLLIYGLIYYFRTRLWQAPVITLTTALAIWIYFITERPERTIDTLNIAGIPAGGSFQQILEQYFTLPVWFVFLVISFISFVTIGKTILHALDLESAAIRLFKISAVKIIDEKNGYTERPFTGGKHSFNDEQLFSFALFLEKKRIVLTEYTEQGVKLIFSMGISPLSNNSMGKVSYVMLSNDGSYTVFIAPNDYRQYKKQYTFDQLCEMMGNTFLRFAKYYTSNNEKRIITELKSIRY
jgi:hypothetical protein